MVLINLAALVMFVLGSMLFLRWWRIWNPEPFSFNLPILEIILLLGAILLTYILHELVHGIAIQLFGGRPEYGVIWRGMMFYATAPGYAFTRNQYLGVALAPLVIGSGLAVVLLTLPIGVKLAWGLAICAAINLSGAVGDVWISLLVSRYSPSARVVDEQDGMRIFTLI